MQDNSAPDRINAVKREFEGVANQFQNHDQIQLMLKYDESLSHAIFAASNMFIIPSIFKPRGLTQRSHTTGPPPSMEFRKQRVRTEIVLSIQHHHRGFITTIAGQLGHTFWSSNLRGSRSSENQRESDLGRRPRVPPPSSASHHRQPSSPLHTSIFWRLSWVETEMRV
ncbi:hypothetical protein K1719_001786 [Acacia pycnantha]|nr:hypothetical protein K1719_001786 [Acacia pycnantha]